MTIVRYRKDPRSDAERQADEEVRKLHEAGELLKVSPARERAALEAVQKRNRKRRIEVARLGKQLGALRRNLGISQANVAEALGTKKSNISRIESGSYGGISVERFIAILEVLKVDGGSPKTRGSASVGEDVFEKFKDAQECIETAR